ncbi:predicted protein [Histoplasma mississippiense (nom. inval.)]|uniref:predicted protein n=1 Tax=Ajellomyces capsulatus (strain NAm1 / WU24) TaxID=2059318 RepID=UPI000157BEED|nr:predicted protein [Histoplasma mississippiense (nom. inval.)]EDN06969.1 predicted protein [Histoplasma mississippiense (nom. inval.)]
MTSTPLEYTNFEPSTHLECFQALAGGTGVDLDTSHASTHILGGLSLNGVFDLYNISPTSYPLANAGTPLPGISPSSEGGWNHVGYSNVESVALTQRSPSRFLSVPALVARDFPAVNHRHPHLRDPKLLADPFQQWRLQKWRNLQSNKPPYVAQRLLQLDLRKPRKNLQPQSCSLYEHQGQALQPGSGFRVSEPMKEPDLVSHQYRNWMSRSTMGNNFNSPGVGILPNLKIFHNIDFNIKEKHDSNFLPETFSENVAYQYPTEEPTGDPNAIDALEPTGVIGHGLKRRSSGDRVIRYLKRKVNTRSEAQGCLVNYRKGGQPFLNLLSVVPIQWLSEEYNYYVGFQVDLVDSPQVVTGKNFDGSYIIDYRRMELSPNIYDQGVLTGSQNKHLSFEYPNRDIVTTAKAKHLRRFSFENPWEKALLGSSEFLFHIISETGVFLYFTPSASTILEYESKELNGSTLSSICHPSDIVTVIREIRSCEPGSVVNLLYRIRRKKSGYTWFESLGSVYIESPQKKKYIAFLGKLLVVFAISRDELMKNSGMNEGEILAKISPSGILLFVSSSGSAFLDRPSEELVGEKVQNLLSGESRAEFENALGIARSGKQVACKHGLQHRRGHLLQVQSTIYPGEGPDAALKPTFLILQIRLLKLGRTIFGFRANTVTAKTRKKDSSALMIRQPVSPDLYSRPSPDLADHSRSNQNSMSSSSSSFITRQQTATRPLLRPNPTHIATFNTHSSDPSRFGNRQEQEWVEKEIRESCNIFEELNPTRATNWQTELDHLRKRNRLLVEELHYLTALKRKRKRKRDVEMPEKDCSQCHTKTTPEWRRGPSGSRDLCNSCGLRWAKQPNNRIAP